MSSCAALVRGRIVVVVRVRTGTVPDALGVSSLGKLRREERDRSMSVEVRSGHPFHMHDAIYAQPGALRLVTRGQGDALAAVATKLGAAPHVWLTGVGSSWHAAMVGELLFATAGRLGARVHAAH